MPKNIAAICRYEQPYSSVQQAVELCAGLEHMPRQAKVFIKPNIVYWTRVCDFPKWGVIITSRVVQDMVQLLKDHGLQSITIGEGIGGRAEVLTGKAMQPSPGMKPTILLGQCMYQKDKDNPDIQKMLAVKGCPPDPGQVQQALHQAGIEVDPRLFSQLDTLPGFFLKG